MHGTWPEGPERSNADDGRSEQLPWADFEKNAPPEITAMFKWFEADGLHLHPASVEPMAVCATEAKADTSVVEVYWLCHER